MVILVEESTEEKILLAAEKIFLRDGYAGSRMQDIADLASINKAMLHYYFRSKDKLFEHIFEKNVKVLFPQIEEMLESNLDFEKVIHGFIEKYIQMLIHNPFLPLFIISTVNNPERQDFLDKIPYHINNRLAIKYHEDLAKGLVNKVDALQFIVSVMAMCIFPFMMKPILKRAANLDDLGFDQFITDRIAEIKNYVSLIIKPK